MHLICRCIINKTTRIIPYKASAPKSFVLRGRCFYGYCYKIRSECVLPAFVSAITPFKLDISNCRACSSISLLYNLAYLIYFEKDKQFFIELPDNADPWETPIILSSFAEKQEMTINSYWSKKWVQQRVVPIDRQNIGQILRNNDLKSYDEYKLLVLANGRCAQDDYYIEPIDEHALPSELTKRFRKKIEDVIPLGGGEYLIYFCNGKIKRCNIKEHTKKNERLATLLKAAPDRTDNAYLMTGG